MAKIAYVKAWGLWSHLETVFNFNPGLTVITGPNGSGKSTLIRIVKWVALGEPAGEDFIFKLTDDVTGEVIKKAEEGKAEIGLDNGVIITKIRRKGKTTYTINTVPEPFEKAEVPQEIKDALGIKKYNFGDFETYLNFAFQMEAPFLISETPSTGAKVLGKLAGTEAVDLAIGEISKRAHKSREERRIAEKEIERITGDLLEYQDVDDLKNQLSACEYLIEETNTCAARKDSLVEMVNSLETSKEVIQRLDSELAGLKLVPLMLEDIKRIELMQQRRDQLDNYRQQLETSLNTINSLNKQLKDYEDLEHAAASLNNLEAAATRCISIKEMAAAYTSYTNTIEGCKVLLDTLKDIDVAASNLAIYEKQAAKQKGLKDLHQLHAAATLTIDKLNQDLDTLQGTEVAGQQLKELSTRTTKLDHLKQVQTEYTNRCIVVAGFMSDVKLATTALVNAEKDLKEAWDAAGGTCPLCEQAVINHNH